MIRTKPSADRAPLQDMVEERTKEVTLLLSESKIHGILHDLKSPGIACISAYLQLVKENDIHVDEKPRKNR